ncbi:MAG: protein TolR [Gammaproteobacteria bacterium]|nr:protein TolR [Gammaproteobacteria bacterium]
MAKRIKRRPVAEINVVPYIDVMLVLLVIFMISTPLLTQGVKVALPQQKSDILELEPSDTIIAKVDKKGDLYLTLGEAKEEKVTEQSLVQQVSIYIKQKPKTTVLVAGDELSEYKEVVKLLVLLNESGVPNVGLMTKPLEQ